MPLLIREIIKLAEKYRVGKRIIRSLKSEIDKLRKASKNKINIHKGNSISDDILKNDLQLLELYEINRKLKNPISTYSLKIELLKLSSDLMQLSPHWHLEYIYRFMERNNWPLRIPGHSDRLLWKDTKNTVINYIIKIRILIKDGDMEIIIL